MNFVAQFERKNWNEHGGKQADQKKESKGGRSHYKIAKRKPQISPPWKPEIYCCAESIMRIYFGH